AEPAWLVTTRRTGLEGYAPGVDCPCAAPATMCNAAASTAAELSQRLRALPCARGFRVVAGRGIGCSAARSACRGVGLRHVEQAQSRCGTVVSLVARGALRGGGVAPADRRAEALQVAHRFLRPLG